MNAIRKPVILTGRDHQATGNWGGTTVMRKNSILKGIVGKDFSFRRILLGSIQY